MSVSRILKRDVPDEKDFSIIPSNNHELNSS